MNLIFWGNEPNDKLWKIYYKWLGNCKEWLALKLIFYFCLRREVQDI